MSTITIAPTQTLLPGLIPIRTQQQQRPPQFGGAGAGVAPPASTAAAGQRFPSTGGRVLKPLTENEVQSLPLTTGEQAVAEFIATYPQCGTREQVSRFIQLSKVAKWRGIDMQSVVRTLVIGGTIDGRVPDGATSRVAGLEFAPSTVGRRGKRQNMSFPSMLWLIAVNNCGHLDALNLGIERVMEGTYGLTVPSVPVAAVRDDPPSSDEINTALAEFFVAHPECSANRKAIYKLLNLIDEYHLSGRDLFALFRTLGLERHLPSLPATGVSRVDKMRIRQQAPPVRGKALSNNVYKMSLLWMLLSEYCGRMDAVIDELSHILSGHLEQGQLGSPGSMQDVTAAVENAPYVRRRRQRRGNSVAETIAPARMPSSALSSSSSSFSSGTAAMSSMSPLSPAASAAASSTAMGLFQPRTPFNPFRLT